MTLELYSERTTRRPADISLSVFLFLNYLSTDREFYPLEGVFRAEYKFRFKPLHTLLLTIASKCSNVCGKTGGDKDNEFYCMT